MSKELYHIDDILKDKMMSFEGNIPLSDWYNIERKLNHRKKVIFIFWSLLSVIVLVGGLVTYNILHKKTVSYSHNVESSIKDKKYVETYQKSEFNTEKEYKVISSEKTKSKINYNKKKQITDIINITKNNTNIDYTYLSIDILSKELNNFYSYNLPGTEKVKDLNLNKLQAATKKPSCKFSFEAGINIAPALGMEAIKGNQKMNNFINRSYFNSISGSSAASSGMNNGLNLQLTYGKNWFLRSGFYVNDYSVYHNYNYTISEFANVDPRYGIISYLPTLPETVKHEGKSIMRFINIPFLLGNRIYISSRYGIESKIGINLSKFYSSSGKSVNPTYLTLEEINTGNIRNWSKGYSISSGIFYKSKRNFIFTIEPNYSSIIGSAYNKNYPVKKRLYNYGLNFNVNYILK